MGVMANSYCDTASKPDNDERAKNENGLSKQTPGLAVGMTRG